MKFIQQYDDRRQGVRDSQSYSSVISLGYNGFVSYDLVVSRMPSSFRRRFVSLPKAALHGLRYSLALTFSTMFAAEVNSQLQNTRIAGPVYSF